VKKIVTSFLVFLMFTPLCNSQTGWYQIDESFPNLDWMDIDFHDANFGITVGVDGRIKRTLDGGANWEFTPSGVTVRLNAVNVVDGQLAFAVGYEGTILKSTNSGATWTSISLTNFPETLLDVQFFDEMTGIVFGSKANVWKTTDGGANWTQQNPRFGQNNVWSVHAFDRENIAICGNGGNISRTTNGGTSWSGQSSPWGQELYSISFADTAYGYCVGTMAKTMRTTDGGENWEMTDLGMPLPSYPFMHVQMIDRNHIRICGWSGMILATADGGVNWVVQDLPSSLGGQHLESLDFVTPGTGFMVGWNGTMLKTIDGGGSLPVENVAGLPSSLAVHGVYPHPARVNAPTAVEFTIPSSGEVSIRIFDLLGKEVASVAPARFEAGQHSVSIPVENLVPGMYLLRISNSISTGARLFTVIR